MRYRLFLAPCGALLTLLVVLCTAAPGFAAGSGRQSSLVQPRVLSLPTPTPTVPAATVEGIVVNVPKNIHTNGFDGQANDGLGGLWINWRYGTQPLQTNFDDAGNAHGSSVPPRQDRLVDLRYVHTLWLYKRQHLDDVQFDGELMKYTNIVKHEFTNHPDERGWVFDTLVDLYRLSHDAFYKHAVQAEVVFLDTQHYVLLQSGKLNPTETFFRGKDLGGHLINGGRVSVGQAAQEILSLLHAYESTRDETLLDKVQELLAPLRAKPNALGLWDMHHLGYYAALTFPSKTIAHPGTPVLSKKTKEGGQQLLMLEAFQVADTLAGGTYSSMVLAMEQVAVNRAYYAAGHGYLDQETADWKPLVLQTGANAGEAKDWVTTEAMGIALEALLSLPQ